MTVFVSTFQITLMLIDMIVLKRIIHVHNHVNVQNLEILARKTPWVKSVDEGAAFAVFAGFVVVQEIRTVGLRETLWKDAKAIDAEPLVSNLEESA